MPPGMASDLRIISIEYSEFLSAGSVGARLQPIPIGRTVGHLSFSPAILRIAPGRCRQSDHSMRENRISDYS